MDQLSDKSREALSIFEKNNIPILPMSAVTDEGVMEVKQQVFKKMSNTSFYILDIISLFFISQACDTLLAYRIENKIQAKKVDSILNRLHVAVPKTRDDKIRPANIPGYYIK